MGRNQSLWKKHWRRRIGALALSGGLLISDVSIIYGAPENQRTENVRTESRQTQEDGKKELMPIEDYMKKCWAEKRERIDVSEYNLTELDVNEIRFGIHYKEPQYYWTIHNYQYETDKETGIVQTYIQYYQGRTGRPFDRSEELECEWEVIKEKTKYCKTDLEKALVVHEHLCDTITYSFDLGVTAHDIEGAILEKKAVCEGYALAFQYYMNRLGIPCKVMSGQSRGQAHAWNQVQINGKWYLVDATWDDPSDSKQGVKHTYFLCSENKFPDHDWEKENEKWERCDDATYDNVDWRWWQKGMCAYQGGLYFYQNGFIGNEMVSGIWRYDAEDPTKPIELVQAIEDKWTINWAGEKESGYSEMTSYGDKLYYSTPRAVWEWNYDKDSEPKKLFELGDEIEGEIWNIDAANGKIYYETATGETSVRQQHSHVIDENYQKAKHPIAVTSTTMTVELGGQEVFLQSEAPGPVTYTSKDPDICDVEQVWGDTSWELVPKKPGETIVTVSAAETDRYLAGSVDVKVIVKGETGEEEKVTLNYEAGENGTLQAENAATGEVLANKAEIAPNTEVEFTAAPNEGYLVKNWIVNGEVYKEDGETYTGTTLKRNIAASTDSVKVEFVEEDSGEEEKIILNYEAGANGTIQAKNAATGESLADKAEIAPNTEVEFTAAPNEGYLVKNWIVNGEIYKEDGETYTGTTLRRNTTASTDSVKVEFVKEEPKFIRGDVDLNGKVDIADLRLTLRYVCQKTELDETQKLAGDVAAGEGVDIADLRKILRYVCKKIDEL